MDVFDTIYKNVLDTKVPTIFLGSGSSIATGIELGIENNFPSMSELAKKYFDNIQPTSEWENRESVFWSKFEAEFEDLEEDWRLFNLERFLLENPLNEDSTLLRELLDLTIDSFHKPHQELKNKLNSDTEFNYSLRQLLEKLLKFRDKNQPYIEIISPNYDLLIEYTADLIGVPCLNGFQGNIIRHWKPEIGLSEPIINRNGTKEIAKHIKYYKPHGSYSWFILDDGDVIEYLGDEHIDQWSRCMIAPGPTKYQNSLRDVRRDHLKYMDGAFERAQSIIVIGYGLNDPHLETGFKKCITKEVPVVIVTKELNDSARQEYLEGNNNVFAVLSDGQNGCLVINNEKEFSYEKSYWKLSNLNKKLIN